MWGHYTENHEGFVIGFDGSHPFFSTRRGPEDEFGFLRQVKVRSQPPKSNFWRTTTGTEWFETEVRGVGHTEKEWRMLRVLRDAENRPEAVPYQYACSAIPQMRLPRSSSA